MSGVFVSYSRGDRGLAERIVRGLRHIGVEVWWDEDMPGVDWQEELARQILGLAAVIVIWTPLSSASKNVRDEARLGQNTEKLVNVLCGVPAPPFPFDRTNGLPLDGWTGREPHSGWSRLVHTIEERLVAVGKAHAGELTRAEAEREATIRARTERIEIAEHEFQAAKAGEEAGAEAVAAARAALETVEELLRLVVDRRASGPVLRASQSDVESAREDLATATAQKTAAAAALADASRGLSRARADLERLFDSSPPSALPPIEPVQRQPPPSSRDSPAAPATTASTPLAAPLAASPPARAAPQARRLPLWAPVAGVAAVAVLGGLLLLGRHKAAPAAAAAPPPSAALAARPVAASPVDPVASVTRTLTGDWSGNGAACASNPFRIAVAGSSLKETLSGTPSAGAITGLEGKRAVRVKFPGDVDPRGDQVYAVSGDTLTVTISKDSMTYQRCPS